MNTLKDALYNLSPQSGTTDPAYGRGILVGTVATLMQFRKCSFAQAVATVKPLLPKDFNPQCIPPAWREDFEVSGT